jgi:hypothetical protein
MRLVVAHFLQTANATNHLHYRHRLRKLDPRISAVPETNAGWVLVPFFGAVLLFSARHLFRGKVAE